MRIIKDPSPASNAFALYLVIQTLLVKYFENVEIYKFVPVFRNLEMLLQ